MRKRTTRKASARGRMLLLALILGGGTVAGCKLITGPASPEMFSVHAQAVDLVWDPPAGENPSGAGALTGYRVYVRSHATGTWRLLDQVGAEQTHYLLQHSMVGDGTFDFAVSAVREGSGESPLHSSLDPSAEPLGGWFVFWRYRSSAPSN